jgi:hypothetical protein
LTNFPPLGRPLPDVTKAATKMIEEFFSELLFALVYPKDKSGKVPRHITWAPFISFIASIIIFTMLYFFPSRVLFFGSYFSLFLFFVSVFIRVYYRVRKRTRE